jgi:hypothetical protein
VTILPSTRRAKSATPRPPICTITEYDTEVVTPVAERTQQDVVLEAVSSAARADLGLGRTDMITLELLTMGRLTPARSANSFALAAAPSLE